MVQYTRIDVAEPDASESGCIRILYEEDVMKKLISLLLILAMLVAAISMIACKNEPDQPQVDPDNTPSDDTPVEDPADDRIPLNLPDVYYGGSKPASFHILEWTANDAFEAGTTWLPWHEGDVTEESDDLMSNAVFARNAYVEEQYGVEITQEYVNVNGNQHMQRLQLDNQTSANEIQLMTSRGLEAWAIIESGLLYDMNEFVGDILHTDQPWWVQDAVKSFTLGDSLYICATEMQLRDKGATSLLYYNTKVATDYGINNFYDLMEMGDWTFEAYISANDVVATSLDGDDLMNSLRDRWGTMGADDTIFMMYAGAGLKLAHIDDDGYMVYDFGDKTSINVMQEIFEDVMYAEWYQNSYANPLDGEGGGFEEDLALFTPSLVKKAYVSLRDMETEYSVLPMPKYDSTQADYCSLVWLHHDSLLGIPSGVANPEMCAVILEALSYEGYYTVMPQLYDTLLYNRLAKSDAARRGFEIVFATRVFDPGQYWNAHSGLVDGKNSILRLTGTGNSNIASVWETNKSATEEQVKLVNEFIDGTR